ncbi:hypothetical protein Hanom_Chr10g00954801 [Helianthus anomalus]
MFIKALLSFEPTMNSKEWKRLVGNVKGSNWVIPFSRSHLFPLPLSIIFNFNVTIRM